MIGGCSRTHSTLTPCLPARFLYVFMKHLVTTLTHQVGHLNDTHEDTQGRGGDHENSEVLLFCRTGQVAVHHIRARIETTFRQSGQVKSFIEIVQDAEETSINGCVNYQTKQVGPPDATTLLSWVFIQMFAFLNDDIILILLFTELDMAHHHERWAGY